LRGVSKVQTVYICLLQLFLQAKQGLNLPDKFVLLPQNGGHGEKQLKIETKGWKTKVLVECQLK